jgi:Rieske Fe-S protein
MTSCDDCLLSGRREFLRQTAAALAAALASIAGAPRDGFALPIRVGVPVRATGGVLSYAVPAADGATIDKESEVILVRFQKRAYAFALSCPHQHTALRWLDADDRFQCPKHKSKYQPDGTFISGKATRNMDRYAIRRTGRFLAVDVTALYRSDKDPDHWAAARVAL